MIITLKSLAKEADERAKHSAADGRMGRKAAGAQDFGYSKVGMWGVLACSAAVAVTGLAICIVSAARDRTGVIFGGLLILMIGMYLMLAAVKEKANLELIVAHFKNLSAESKDEMIQMLVKGNAGTSKDVLGVIEKLMNIVFKKGNL